VPSLYDEDDLDYDELDQGANDSTGY
jgi:hypothetical protein